MQRRKVLSGLVTVGIIGTAGCSSISGGGGANEAAKQYYTAAKEMDVEKANEVVHPESSSYPVSERDLEDLSDAELVGIEKISSSERAEVERTSEKTLKNNKQYLKSEYGVNEVTYVMYTLKFNSGTINEAVTVVKDEGDWRLFIN